MKKLITYFSITALLVVFTAFPVLAADSNNNEFVDFNDYAEYEFADDNSSVTVSSVFPEEWNISFLSIKDSGIYDWFYGSELEIDGSTEEWEKLNMHPMGGNMHFSTDVGDSISNAHFIDLRYIPDGTTLTYEFSVGISTYDVNVDEQIFTRYFYFVDETGNVIERWRYYFDPEMNGHGSYLWSESIDTSSFPEDAVGLIPMFSLRNFTAAFDTVLVQLSSFEFVIPMSALEFDNMQNQQLQSTLDNVKKAQDETNQKIDDFLNSEVEPEKSPIDDSINGLDQAESELMDKTNKGFEELGKIVIQAIAELNAYVTAFVAVSSVIERFFTLPILGGVIYISLAIGIFALIVNLGSDVQRAGKKNNTSKPKGGKGK